MSKQLPQSPRDHNKTIRTQHKRHQAFINKYTSEFYLCKQIWSYRSNKPLQAVGTWMYKTDQI